jgi:hypothetical protein
MVEIFTVGLIIGILIGATFFGASDDIIEVS